MEAVEKYDGSSWRGMIGLTFGIKWGNMYMHVLGLKIYDFIYIKRSKIEMLKEVICRKLYSADTCNCICREA